MSIIRHSRLLSHLRNAYQHKAFMSTQPEVTLYKALGIQPNCTHQELKEAFYRLSKLYHPDLTNDPGSRIKFQNIARAYEILGNASKRRDYDRGLMQPGNSVSFDDSAVYDGIGKDSFKRSGSDKFSTFYVKHYNRALNDAWFRQSDPELIKTSMEHKQDERNFIAVIYCLIGSAIIFGYVYSKWYEEPIKLVSIKKSDE